MIKICWFGWGGQSGKNTLYESYKINPIRNQETTRISKKTFN